MPPILEVKNLTKRYYDFTLNDISLDVGAGCITGIFGPSGAGKTTLIKLIADQLAATEGTVKVFGLGYGDHATQIKNRIGYVGEEQVFYKDKSVEWIARFVAHFYQRWDGSCFGRLLDEFKIARRKKIKQLSRGRKTLLALAIALSHEAELLLLDEPAAGLDLVIRREVLRMLREFVADEKRTVIVSSHITDGLADIVDYVTFLADGTLILDTEKDTLLADARWIHFKDKTLDPSLRETLCSCEHHQFGNRGLSRDFTTIKHQLEPGLAAGDIKVENASLDDILISMVKGV